MTLQCLSQPKKITSGQHGRDEFSRSQWRMEAGTIDAGRVVFVVEMAARTS